MRVCLVRCPSPFLIDDRVFPPLGLLSVGTALRAQGHEVSVYDGAPEFVPEDFDAYGFGPTTPEYPQALVMRDRLRRAGPARFVVGGPHATLVPDHCLSDGWDAVVVGDGEDVTEFALANPGVHRGAERPLDAYPIADRSLVEIRDYRYVLDGRPATSLVTGKGCPYRCGFCAKTYGTVRLRSAGSVMKEIRYLQEELGFEALLFPEDLFIVHRSRAESICAGLRERGIWWRCLVRGDLVVRYGPDFVRMMARSGLREVGMGIESGSDRILDGIQKGEDTSTMRAAIGLLRDEGVRVKGYFVLGLPGENRETLEETRRFLDEMNLDDVDIKILTPYPGSPIWEHPERYDVAWDRQEPLATRYYKGRVGEYEGSLRTSSLTTEELVAQWRVIEREFKEKRQCQT